MTTTDQEKMKTEMVVFLRNSDILSTTQRGVTTTSNIFTATAGQTVFTLSNAVTRNIRSVTVATVAKTAYFDYTPEYKSISTTVTLLTAATGGETVNVGFDYSGALQEKVFPDYPEIQYLVNDCPRIGFDFIAQRTKVIGIGNTNWLSDALVSIKVYDKNTKSIDGYISTIRSKIKNAQKSFYHFPLVNISNVGPPILHDIYDKTKLAGKVFEKSVDLICRWNFEA